MDTNIANLWLQSGLPAFIRGIRLVPKAYPRLKHTAFYEKGNQGVVFHLMQPSNKQEWVLKKFVAEMKPDPPYLVAIRSLVPRGIAFKAASKRVIVKAEDIKLGEGTYSSTEFNDWLDETVLMPKMRGRTWKAVAEDLRNGAVDLSLDKRLSLARYLAEAVRAMEDNGCAHRDLCHENICCDLQEYVVALVDWDSMFHGSLYFHKNTPAGSNGYMAPWIKEKNGKWDPRKSWNRKADRFALAILIGEFFTVKRNSPTSEGALFSQQALAKPRHATIAETLENLYALSTALGDLFQQAITAGSYDECPAPINWQEALEDELLEKETQTPSFQEEQEDDDEHAFEEGDFEEEEFMSSASAISRPATSSRANYWLLLLVLLVPLAVWIVYQLRQGDDSMLPPNKSALVTPVPTTEVPLAANAKHGTELQLYLCKILYADDDLKVKIADRNIDLNNENTARVNIAPGRYPVSLTFTGVVFHQNGKIERTAPVTITQEINFADNKNLIIHINRGKKTWQIVDTR